MTDADGKRRPQGVDVYLQCGDKLYLVLREAMECRECGRLCFMFVERLGKNARCFACEGADEWAMGIGA